MKKVAVYHQRENVRRRTSAGAPSPLGSAGQSRTLSLSVVTAPEFERCRSPVGPKAPAAQSSEAGCLSCHIDCRTGNATRR